MKIHFTILILLLFNSCLDSNQSKQKEELLDKRNKGSNKLKQCEYINDYKDVGNRIIDTTRIEKRLVDPIDDFTTFEETEFGFVKRGDKIYKKSKTHRRCDGKFIDIEYYQEFTNRIELSSYKEYNDRFFATKNKVNFWWVNSDGHLIVPVDNADPKTFKPFENMCGGTDKNGIYYGCPNYGVYQLEIPIKSKFEFIEKEDNYWNSPKNYLIVEDKVYDIKYKLKKGYFCELDKTVSVNEILKLKK